MSDTEIIGICVYCKQPIYENEKYHEALLRKGVYYHDTCAKMLRTKAFAVGAWLRT